MEAGQVQSQVLELRKHHGRFSPQLPVQAGATPASGASEPSASIVFRHFRVLPHRRELLAGGRPVKLGGRAFDLLMALIEASGAALSKDALMARAWPNRIVEESALHAQIAGLRKAFGTERDLIRTISGRGYQFTGEVRSVTASPGEYGVGSLEPAEPESGLPPTNLPEPVSELIGRNNELGEILKLATAHRLVTLTGTGGIGKTRLALATARYLLPKSLDGVWFAELASVADPALVPAAVAAALDLELPAGTVSPKAVASALNGKRLLLVLDNCEHVIDAAAALAETVLRANPTARMLVTSREPLRTDGEWIYRVPPLAVPARDAEDDPLQDGAVRLFFERVRAVEPHLAPDRHLTMTMAAICRRLDAIPLAIELAAGRTAALGVEPFTGPLDEVFPLLAGGRRTAATRHQSLRASLDWSYARLSDCERTILRRLSIFPGHFDLQAAVGVAASADLNEATIIDGLANLITKSLITTDGDGIDADYRLLATTRAYALEKLSVSAEHAEVGRRLADYREHNRGSTKPARRSRYVAPLPPSASTQTVAPALAS